MGKNWKWADFRVKPKSLIGEIQDCPYYRLYCKWCKSLDIAPAAYDVWYQLSKGGW